MNDKNNQKINLQEDESVLKQVRIALGLSQEQFAYKLGVTHGTISRWERGVRQTPKFSVPQIKNLVDVLSEVGLTVHDLPNDRL